ncbi:MAG: peptidoglycan DD-metalloendopeptidase family protein [Formosimonas sp.]
MKKILVVGLAVLLAACGTTGGSAGGHSRKADANGMYRVRAGDTLVLIARANGVDYTDLMRWNGLTNPNRLEVGWRLRTRAPASNGVAPPVESSGGVAVTKAQMPAKADRDMAANPQIDRNVVWRWPVAGAVLKRFDGATSKGLVFGGNLNDPVQAAAAGEVIYAGNGLRGYGNMVVINHSDSWSSVYANNNALLVHKGDKVSAGQVIAKMGNSDVQRVQLYFEVRLNAKSIDPYQVLPAR